MKVSELISYLQNHCKPSDLVLLPAEDDGHRDIKTIIQAPVFIGRKETRYKGKYLTKLVHDNETMQAVILFHE